MAVKQQSARHKGKLPRRPQVGSSEWLEGLVAKAEEGLVAAEHDLSKLYDAILGLKEHQAWETLLPDEPRTWQRLLETRIDPVHQRIEWVEALLAGYAKLRTDGHDKRITRRDAEAAVGYRVQQVAAQEMHGQSPPNPSPQVDLQLALDDLERAWRVSTPPEKAQVRQRLERLLRTETDSDQQDQA